MIQKSHSATGKSEMHRSPHQEMFHQSGEAQFLDHFWECLFPEDLFIQAFCVSSDILSRSLNAKFINVVEFGVEGHQDEYEWFRGRRNWLSIHFRLLKRIQRKDNRHSRYSASEGKRKK